MSGQTTTSLAKPFCTLCGSQHPNGHCIKCSHEAIMLAMLPVQRVPVDCIRTFVIKPLPLCLPAPIENRPTN